MRTDIHRESKLKPEDYEFIGDIVPMPKYQEGGLDALKSWLAWRAETEQLLTTHGVEIHTGRNRCDHCGAWFDWGYLLSHTPSGKVLCVGNVCADTRFSMSNLDFKRKQAAKVRAQVRHRRGLFAKLWTWAHDHPEELKVLNRWSKTNDFLQSLRSQLRRNGTLSDNQVSCILAAGERAEEWETKRKAISSKAILSEYQGEVGERIVIQAEVQMVRGLESFSAYDAAPRYITKLVDSDDNVYIQYGAWIGDKGDTVNGKATVKKHSEYDGCKQTVVQRFLHTKAK